MEGGREEDAWEERRTSGGLGLGFELERESLVEREPGIRGGGRVVGGLDGWGGWEIRMGLEERESLREREGWWEGGEIAEVGWVRGVAEEPAEEEEEDRENLEGREWEGEPTGGWLRRGLSGMDCSED